MGLGSFTSILLARKNIHGFTDGERGNNTKPSIPIVFVREGHASLTELIYFFYCLLKGVEIKEIHIPGLIFSKMRSAPANCLSGKEIRKNHIFLSFLH